MSIADLESGAVHLWYVAPESVTDASLVTRWLDLLDPKEKERQARFKFSQHRHTFLVAHLGNRARRALKPNQFRIAVLVMLMALGASLVFRWLFAV